MSDPFGPSGPPPPLPPPLPPMVPPRSSGQPDFLQPKYLIALVVAAVLMLVAGIAAITSGGGDESITTGEASTTSSDLPTTTRVLTTTPPPLPATTTTSATTSTTSSTSTTTTSSSPPVPAVANAGDDLAVDTDATVALTALDLSDQNQSVVWRQVAGPDVTDGRERLIGAEVTFVAPSRPTTLRFRVTVTGRGGDAVNDEVRVDVYEQADRALFVDGVDGSNGGDGSRSQPYRDLAAAISAAEARGNGTDIYIRTVDSAYAVDAEIRNGSSLYGGYDADWVKADESRALIGGSLLFTGSDPIVVSSIDLRGADDADGSVLGVIGAASVRIEGSVVRAGNSLTGSIAVLIEAVASAEVINSEISAGRAGNGARALDVASPEPPLVPGSVGNNASGPSGGAALAGMPITRGGDGGLGLVDGDQGGGGALGGSSGENGAPGAGGVGGAPGRGGIGGVGLGSDGLVGAAGLPGASGGGGATGAGGGGGGGLLVHDGGGAGGGGGAGQGGPGGLGGGGGHPSIALFVRDVATFQLHGSKVVGGVGGDGGKGGRPLDGSVGGGGGLGAPGVSSFLGTAGSGGNGGGGGSGGQGGWGGGGSGGPSIGLLTIDVATALVSDSEIRGGQGGSGGSGGQPAAGGAPGADGGAGGAGLGASRGAMAPQSSGGDSVGWRDDSDARREIVASTIAAGTPGGPGGVGGPTGQANDTMF